MNEPWQDYTNNADTAAPTEQGPWQDFDGPWKDFSEEKITPSLQPELNPPGEMPQFALAPESYHVALTEKALADADQFNPRSSYTPEQQERLAHGSLAENLLSGIPGLEITKSPPNTEELLNSYPWMDAHSAADVAGVLQTAAGAWNTIVSPVGIVGGLASTLAGQPGVVGLVGKAALGTFAIEATRQMPDAIGEYLEARKSGDEQRIAQTASALVLNAAVAFGSAKGAAEPLRLVPRTQSALAETVKTLPKDIEDVRPALPPSSDLVPPIVEQPELPFTALDAVDKRSEALRPTTPETPAPEAPSTSDLGAVPTVVAALDTSIRETATKLEQFRQAIPDYFARSEPKEDIVRKLDAADNEAKIEGEQTGNSVRLDMPDVRDREAVTFIVEANGDRARLDEFAEQVAGNNAHAATVIDFARENYDRLLPYAERVNSLHDAQLFYEQGNGIDPGDVEGYVRHVYDMDAMIGRGRPVLLAQPSGAVGISTSFKKQRAFSTYAEAIAAGFKPKTFDVADLVQSRITIGERLVNRTRWANAFRDVLDPVEQRPIITSPITQQPKGTQVAPLGYKLMDVMPGNRVAVHEGYADLFDTLLAPSQVRGIGKAILKGEALIKHGMLAVDSFHVGRMLYKELAMSHDISHDLGRSLLEYSDADLQRAVDAGEIPEKAASFARENRADAELLTANGLNVGRIADALYKDVVRDIPLIGQFNRWVFDKLTRGAMLTSALSELARLRPLRPDLSEAQLAGLVAKNINTYYGNLGRQGIFKSATMQDLARIVTLAPQWVEGMARTEGGAVIQAGQVPVDLARGRGLVIGPLAKAVGTGILATAIVNQLINLGTRGHPTWQNPEHGHQLDAWIPDVTGKTPGFFFSPLSIFAELSHDAMRYYSDDPHALKVLSRILSNKLSPIAHAEEVLRTGKDWLGRDLPGTWERTVEAGKALVPAPIPLKPFVGELVGESPPAGSLQRQLFGSAGIKIEPAPSADSQLYRMAHHFKESQGIKEPPSEPSEYRALNNALRDKDTKQSKHEYQKLLESGKSEKTVREHYNHLRHQLYTGKRSLEAEFKGGLNDAESTLFDKAKEERNTLRDAFLEMLSEPEKQ